MIKISICDDEKEWLDMIFEKISEAFKTHLVEIQIRTYSKVGELVNNLDGLDVLFLDIEMPEQNGFEVAKIIKNYNSEIMLIFVTSHSELVFKSFHFTPFNFLHKSELINSGEDFNICIRDIIEKIDYKNLNMQFRTIEFGNITLSLKDIMYFKASGHNVILCTNLSDKRNTFLIYSTLKKIETEILKSNYKYFLKPEKSFLVNCMFIKKITEKIILKNEVAIPLGVKKRREIERKYLEFLSRT